MTGDGGDDPDFGYLTTTGRRTGEPHTVELWYRPDPTDETTVWFMAGIDPPIVGGRPDWVRNLEVDPHAHVRIGDGPGREARATVEEGGDDLRRSFAARYQGWQEGTELSRWALTSLTVAVRARPGV